MLTFQIRDGETGGRKAWEEISSNSGDEREVKRR